MMTYFVHVDALYQPGGEHFRHLLMLGITHQQASPFTVAVPIEIGIHRKAQAIAVSAFVFKRNRPHTGEIKIAEPQLIPLR